MEQFESEFDSNVGAQCLDVREPQEYAETHLKLFKLQSLSNLSEKSTATLEKSKRTYLLCRTGNRACQAADKLEKMGFTDLNVIEGGMGAFEAAGKPLIKGSSKVWGLERQVRFSAGALVLLGIILAGTVHQGGIFLSIFVAGGLIFSAVTDTCGMGMLLARMPWNQSSR